MDWIDEIVAEIWLEIGKRLDCPHKPLADLDIGPIIRRHLNTAHPQPAPEPIRVLDRLEKRVFRLEQALLKQQADEYHADEEKPAPEPFKVPVVEMQTVSDEGSFVLIVNGCMYCQYAPSHRRIFEGIAHTCKYMDIAMTYTRDRQAGTLGRTEYGEHMAALHQAFNAGPRLPFCPKCGQKAEVIDA